MALKLQDKAVSPKVQEEVEEAKSVGSWTFHENLLYIAFLQKNKVVMQSKRKRRNQRIFDRMSDFILTRTSLQCRSHHQKFLEKLGDIKSIIHNFKKYLSKDEFRERYVEAMALRTEGNNQASKNTSVKLEESEQIVEADQANSTSRPLSQERETPKVKSEAETGSKEERQSANQQGIVLPQVSGFNGLTSSDSFGQGSFRSVHMSQFQMMLMLQRQMMGYPMVNPYCQPMMPFF